MGINLVHTSEIEKFFLQQADGDLQLASWLNTGLMRSICRRVQSAVELREMPEDAPGWLRRKWPEGGPFHRFIPDAELTDKVRHIVDWLSCARQENAPFLERRDDAGVPLKIHNISLESAFNAANKYFGRAHSRAAPLAAKAKGAEEPGIVTVMELAQGRRIVEITGSAALKAEGLRMKHCVGGYGFSLLTGQLSFYSLRDADGRPTATISLYSDGLLYQCKGPWDRTAEHRYLAEIAAFLDTRKARIPRIHPDLPGYYQPEGGALTPLYALPEGYHFQQHLNMCDCHVSKELPARLVINGEAFIDKCSVLERIGAGLTVMKSLYIRDCHALGQLPADLVVGNQLRVESSALQRLPEGLRVNGDLVLENCRRLASLGSFVMARHVYVTDCENLVLEKHTALMGWLVFSARRRPLHIAGDITIAGSLSVEGREEITFGDNLHITGDLHLKDCPKLTTLPRGLRVDGDLTITNSGITEIPEATRIAGGLKLENCARLQHVAGPQLDVPGMLYLADCPELKRLPPLMTVGKELCLFRCPQLGPLLPQQLAACPKIRTDLYLSAEASSF